MDDSHRVRIFTKGNLQIITILDNKQIFCDTKKTKHYFLAFELTWKDLGLSRYQHAASLQRFVGSTVSYGNPTKKLLYTR